VTSHHQLVISPYLRLRIVTSPRQLVISSHLHSADRDLPVSPADRDLPRPHVERCDAATTRRPRDATTGVAAAAARRAFHLPRRRPQLRERPRERVTEQRAHTRGRGGAVHLTSDRTQ
jgi:hypothetical protein